MKSYLKYFIICVNSPKICLKSSVVKTLRRISISVRTSNAFLKGFSL